jgi:hypothetical protein
MDFSSERMVASYGKEAAKLGNMTAVKDGHLIEVEKFPIFLVAVLHLI